MSSTSETTRPSPTLTDRVTKYWDRMGKLNLWAGTMANQSLQDHVNEQRKNQAAEGAFVRRALWKSDETGMQDASDMGDTILGDVTHPTPVIVAGQQNGGSFLKAAAAVLLGAAVPSSFVAGWLLKEAPEAVEAVDESVSLGLGKLEEYLRADERVE